MSILVTGASGFIGQAIVKALSSDDRVIALKSQDINLIRPTATQQLVELMTQEQVTDVIHLAARVCTAQNKMDLHLFEDNKLMGIHVIEAARKIKLKSFIHASTMAVYPVKDGACDETTAPNPAINGDGLYGLAKWHVEQVADFYLLKYMPVVHLRMTQVFGPGMRVDRIFPSMIQEIRDKNTVSVYGLGERITNFIHINDVVSTFKYIWRSPKAGVYNLGGDWHWDMNSWADHIIKAYGNSQTKKILLPQGSRIKQYIKSDLLSSTFGIRNSTVDVQGVL